jgi:hypothetical protein
MGLDWRVRIKYPSAWPTNQAVKYAHVAISHFKGVSLNPKFVAHEGIAPCSHNRLWRNPKAGKDAGLDRIWASPSSTTRTGSCKQLMHGRDEDLILTSPSLLPVADAAKFMLLKITCGYFAWLTILLRPKILILSIERNERFRLA